MEEEINIIPKIKEITKKEFTKKVFLFCAIVLVWALLMVMVGAKWGYARGVNAATEWYDDKYIPRYCSCTDKPNYYFGNFSLETGIINST